MNKKIILPSVIMLLMVIFACKFTSESQNTQSSTSQNTKSNIKQITKSGTNYKAYYFHRTGRCTACINLENFSKELIETKYSKYFTYESINVDEEANDHFIKDYNLEFSSLILAKFKDDQQLKWKNLDSIWSYSDDKEKFFDYAGKEINKFMK